MKRNFKCLVALVLLLSIIVSCFVPVSAVSEPSTYSKSKNSGTRDVVCTTLSGTSASSYYTGSYTYDKLETLSASSLLTTLRTLMTSTHKTKTSYTDCKNYANKTDCQNEDGTVVLLYTSYVATMSDYISGSVGWNREHVWPQSLGGGNTSGGGSDLHHIRPDDVDTNGKRGNKLFGEVSGGTQATGSSLVNGQSGGVYSGNYFEPHDNVKGDVARICLYVYVRWGSEWGAESITEVFQSVDVLLDWCELDPVDTWEMGRNEVVQNIQGNRNVFIDYPELAWLLFGREVPSDMATPSGEAKGGTGSSGGSGGSGNTSCQHSSTEVRNKVSATCGAAGYTGDTYCKSCGEKISTGRTVLATGKHTWGSLVVVTPATETSTGLGKKTCTVCGETATEVIPMLEAECEHSTTEIRNKANATCGAAGYSGDTYCTECGVKLSSGSTVLATGQHTWGGLAVVTPATETSAGVGRKTCTVCGEYKTETIPMLDPDCDHLNKEVKYQVDATCHSAGYTGDTYCTDCGAFISEGSRIPMTDDHKWGESVIVQPTEESEGSEKKTCTVCGEVSITSIPRIEISGREKLAKLIASLGDEEQIIILIHLGVLDKELYELIDD